VVAYGTGNAQAEGRARKRVIAPWNVSSAAKASLTAESRTNEERIIN